MNGMSLAALLGAATWFGLKEAKEPAPEAPAPPNVPPAPEADGAPESTDFIWAPNPLFQ